MSTHQLRDPDRVFAGSLAFAISPLAGAAYVLLAEEFHVSVDEVVSCFSANFIGAAIFMLLQNPFAVKYGHRVVYLVSTFLMFISCIWSALSTGLVSISASRVFQGFGGAPVQSLISITIGQLYFVHERGSRMCILGIFQGAGTVLSPLINGYVIQNLSWRLGFWFVSIACGLSFIGVVIFVPETTYLRQSSFKRDSTLIKYENATDKNSIKTPHMPKTPNVDIQNVQSHRDDATPSNRPTFLSQLRIYNGTFSEESVWKIFLRPFPFLLSPVTWFMLLTNLIPTVLFGLVSLCMSTIFTVTHGFNTTQIGLTHLGGLIGIVLVIFVAGPLGDWWIVWISQRNRGVYEPEFRLVSMLSLLFGAFAYVGWAIGNDHHMPWIGAVACIAMLYFSSAVSAVAAIPYLIDAHGDNSLHIVSLIEFAKNVLIYGSAFFANGIILSAGVKLSLLVYGVCQAVCWLTCIPMYVYGKRVRSFIARHPRLFNRDLPVSDFPTSPSPSGSESKD